MWILFLFKSIFSLSLLLLLISIWGIFFLIKFLEWTDVAVLGLLFIVFSLIFSILEFLFLDNSLSSKEGKSLLKALTGVFWFLNEL